MSTSSQAMERFLSSLRRRCRCNRALEVVVFSVGGISVGHAALVVCRIAGWIAYPEWSNGMSAGAAATVVLVVLISLFLPVREAKALGTADARLGLQGALVTAMEVRDSGEPIRRLLVSRTARAIVDTRPGKALPIRPPGAALLVPALVVLAFGLEVVATSGIREVEKTVHAPEVLRFSGDLQAAVTRMYLDDAGAPEAVGDDVRGLLEIDGRLLRGEISLDLAHGELARWLDARQQEGIPLPEALRDLANARDGGRSAPDGGAIASRSGRGKSGAGGPGAAGRGEGAGTGLASTGPGEAGDLVTGESARGTSIWVLPRSERFTGIARSGSTPQSGPDRVPSGDVEQTGTRLASVRAGLTARELELVAAYHRALDLQDRDRGRYAADERTSNRKAGNEGSQR